MTKQHSAPCTIRISENEHGAISVDAGVEVSDPRNLTPIQSLALVGVTAIIDAMVEYREKARNETTH